MPITWPFAIWGLGMVGPFVTASSGYTRLLVAVDKFIKWVEAKPDGAITTKFVKDIVVRYSKAS
jgi:hypothetical protein